jgi:hypothetical protein
MVIVLQRGRYNWLQVLVLADDDDDDDSTTWNYDFPFPFLRILTEDTEYVGVTQDCSLKGHDSVHCGS